MYAGALPLLIGVPLALASWWGLFVLILFMPALIWRLLDEEKFLAKYLPGYVAYQKQGEVSLVTISFVAFFPSPSSLVQEIHTPTLTGFL
jgi:protein-S-isoprenylcysteine O-methyltransferase Ste14